LGRADTGVGNGWEFETARPSTKSHSDGEYLVSTVMFLEGNMTASTISATARN
jgi:hypothetical protein